MYFLNYLLLICFISFANSFTFTNKKYSPCFFSRHFITELNMGCDYYIDKDLNIYYHNDESFSSINLQHEKGYYWFESTLDEDEDGYESERKEYIKKTLEPYMKPISIYSNNTFNKLQFENKYKKIIEDELNILNKTWNDINKVIKIESRYER